MNFIKARDYFVNIISKGHERSIKAKKNILYSFGLQGISIIIGFIYVPLLLDYLDNERYGIWLTLTSIMGWFEFFNVGLGNGLKNKFTEAVALGKHELARVYVSTTYAIVIIIFSFVLAVFYFANHFIHWDNILNTTIIPARELSMLVLIVFSFFIFRFILKLIGIILVADQRPAVYNAFMPTGNIITLIIIIILIRVTNEGSLIILGLVLSAVPVIVLLIMTIFLFNGRYKKYRPSIKYVNLGISHSLMKLGRMFFIIQISAIVLYTTSNIIITQYLGPQEVTVYNIAYKYFSLPIMAYAIIMTPIWSAVTDAYVKNDFNWLKNALRKLNVFSAIFVLLIIVMLLTSGFVYKMWIGDRVSVPFILSATMALFAINNVVLPPYTQFINGFGKLKLTIIIVIFQTIIFIPLAIFMVKSSLGVAGVMLATWIINGIGFLYVPAQTYKILNKTAKGIWNK